MTEREDKIREARLRQPLSELERKSDKAARPGWWTQEDLDLAKRKARELYKYFKWKME
jgi:hypothetical protein